MTDFKHHVLQAAGRADVQDAVECLYATVQSEIDARRPICVASGKCCGFEEYGHGLFVTTVEMAGFVHHLKSRDAPESAKPPSDGPRRISLDICLLSVVPTELGCRFQADKLCSVHEFRPFGCRMFFCDATSTEWQNQQYERFHAELKRLHESLSIPYYYIEWRQALRECLDSPEDIL